MQEFLKGGGLSIDRLIEERNIGLCIHPCTTFDHDCRFSRVI